MPSAPASRYYRTTGTPFYDPSIRDYVVASNGLTEDVHPVDQRVAILMSTLQGKIAGDATLGYLSPGKTGNLQAANEIRRAVLVTVEPVLVDGDIEVIDILVEFPQRGQTDIELVYRNLRASQSIQASKARVSFGGS